MGPFAIEDITGIYAYSADQWGTNQAKKYVESIKTGFENISQYPSLWKQYRWKQYEVNYTRVERHVGVFIVKEDQIYVLRLFGDRMDLDRRIQEFIDTYRVQ